MKDALDAIGINIGSAYARCACVKNKNAAPVMIPNRWGKTFTDSKGRDSAYLLRTLRENAEVFMERLVSSCVLTVRPGFSPPQREAVAKAAEEAGMTSVSVISDPLAVALASGGQGRLLILDVGAAGSEITAVEVQSGSQKVLESATHETGGCYFDAALAEWLRDRLGLDPMSGDDPRHRALLAEAETIKVALSSCSVYDWQPPSLDSRIFPSVRVEREDLERMTRFAIKRLVNAAGRMWEKYRPERLLLTGGSSRTPLLRETAERYITRSERLNFGPEDTAAAGAAIYAAGLNGLPKNAGPGKNPLAADRRMRDLKTRLVRMEPSLSPTHQKRLHLMMEKMSGMENNSSSIEFLEGVVKDLEKELFPGSS